MLVREDVANDRFSDNCLIRFSISCPTASPGVTSAASALASASEIRDPCGRTYVRYSSLVFFSRCGSHLFSLLHMGIAPVEMAQRP